jgi:hypothetical protein
METKKIMYKMIDVVIEMTLLAITVNVSDIWYKTVEQKDMICKCKATIIIKEVKGSTRGIHSTHMKSSTLSVTICKLDRVEEINIKSKDTNNSKHQAGKIVTTFSNF